MSKKVVPLTLAAVLSCVALIAVSAPAAAEPGRVDDGTCGRGFGSANWNTGRDPKLVKALIIRIRVGDDDIRSGTQVYLSTVINRMGERISLKEKQLIPSGWSWPNGTLLQDTYQLRTETDEVPELLTDWDIEAIKIRHESGQPDFLSTPDNWNMNDIQVFYPNDGSLFPSVPDSNADIDRSQFTELLSGSGRPWLYRFKADCEEQGGPSWTLWRMR